MSFFFTGPIKTDKGYVVDSYINNTYIDMNNKKITSLGDPTDPQDAVNLRSLQNNISYQNISLLNTDSVLILNKMYGSYYITITGNTDNLASAVFSISKSLSSLNIIGNRLSHSGTGDLEIYWPPSEGIYIKKNSNTQNGQYIVKII